MTIKRGQFFFFSLCLSTKTYSWYIEYLGVLSDNGYKYFNGNMYMYSYLNSRLCFLLPYWSPVIRFDTGRLLTLYIHGWHILPSAYVKMCFYVYYICMYIYIYILNTVIPRLTKTIRSGITVVSRNVISRRFL